MQLICWGTRGSLPSPGPDTVRFGGRTSCIEVRAASGRSLVFDAGTGIVPLGERLVRQHRPRHVDLFLTHFHSDHIQGLPFFAPLYDAAWSIRIHAVSPNGMSLEDLLAEQMREPFFPVALRDVPAHVEYRDLQNTAWVDGELRVVPFRVRHPSHA
jgi:phosphoribosyl 1,2-cyclic phosphodiesterase